jgi:hypothetical protein
MQLDLFEHSRDTMLRNDVLHALQQHDAVLARHAWLVLAAEFAQDAALAGLDILVGTLEASDDAAFSQTAAAATAVGALRDRVEPAARRLFDDRQATEWLKPHWHRLARRAKPLAFDASCAEAHAAPLYLRAGDPSAASEAVARIASWRRIPLPLAWMLEARWQLDGLDTSWPLLAELCWLAPARADALLRRLPDPVLQRLRRGFDAAWDGVGDSGDLAWFPAWLLTEKPALAPMLGQAQASLADAPERAMRTLLDLLHLERQGRQREQVEQRRRLRALHGALYEAYMRSR